MNLAYGMQKFQDWCTQQWVIFRGKKFIPKENSWLIGPFGELNGIGETFIYQLAQQENLIVRRNCRPNGLFTSINSLDLNKTDLSRLSKKVIHFYEHTANYQLAFKVKWNPFFRILGYFVNRLFSRRINQLNIPTKDISDAETLNSEIITLVCLDSNTVKYTIWLRKFESTGKVIYSGIYETCKLPSGKTCVKAIFPLPKGNATVIMTPSVGENKELILDSSGNTFGDAGFYFLLNDSKNNYWAKFISSFTDRLIVYENQNALRASQTLKLWNFKVATFQYEIKPIQ